MTPSQFDSAVVARRLSAIDETLGEMRALAGVTAAELSDDPMRRAAAERLVQVVVDLAVDINSHIAASVSGRAPDTGRGSFLDAAEAGAISRELADELAPAAGMRNVLIHRYVEIRPDLVADAINQILEIFPEYMRQVSTFVGTFGS